MTNRTHKIQIDPTHKQQVYFCKGCGIARFAWNWSLSKWEEQYKAGCKTNALELKKEFNRLKESEFPWAYEVTWFISVNVETSQVPAVWENQAVVGVDLGIKAFATLSDGKSIPPNQPMYRF